jgi:ketosteroid isomerase-like protein
MRAKFLLSLFLCILAVAAIVPSSPASAQSRPVRSDQDVLMQLERDWDSALRRNDVKFIDSILADDFIVTYDDGSRGDRRTELEFAARYDQTVTSSMLDEFIVREYGNTAIVWFTLHLSGPIKGQTVELNYRFSDVFVLRDTKWLCVSSQSTRLLSPSVTLTEPAPQ